MAKTGRKILLVTLEPIAEKMAGPAIRCLELGKQLASEFAVTVFSPAKSDFQSPDVTVISGLNRQKLYALAAAHDIIFVQANVLKPFPRLAEMGKYLVVDLYDPYLLALLAQYADEPVTASSSYRLMHQVLEKHMLKADFTICASERQRDYWIGRFCAQGRLTPQLYKFDPSFRKLIDVVPFGLPAGAPVASGPGMKGHVPGIKACDQVLLWGGGIWQWFDPLTVIKAVGRLRDTHPKLKLFFMGWNSPNPQVPVMEMALAAKQLAHDLKLLNEHVFFYESWIPYDQRVNYLLDADIAVSAHFDLPETRFSFRTRILDYFWAHLPILTTGGDQLAELISTNSAGMSMPYGDDVAWADAIASILGDSHLKEKFQTGSAKLAEQFTWQKAAEPLKRYCRDPHYLPAHHKVTMPSLVERAQAIYARGGKELVLKRSSEIISSWTK